MRLRRGRNRFHSRSPVLILRRLRLVQSHRFGDEKEKRQECRFPESDAQKRVPPALRGNGTLAASFYYTRYRNPAEQRTRKPMLLPRPAGAELVRNAGRQ